MAFAYDPARAAILLIAGDKSGVGEARFYRDLIANADRRFDAQVKRVATRMVKPPPKAKSKRR